MSRRPGEAAAADAWNASPFKGADQPKVRHLEQDEARRLLDKLVGREKNESQLSRLPTDTRNKLRAACADVGQFPCRSLLVPTGLGELEPLLHAQPGAEGIHTIALTGGRMLILRPVPVSRDMSDIPTPIGVRRERTPKT